MGILHVVLNAFNTLLGLVFIGLGVVGSAVLSPEGPLAFLVGGLGVVLGAGFLIPSLPGLVGGIGLLSLKTWARWVIVVVSVLNLAVFPYGTAIAIYSLWALLNQQAELAFQMAGIPPRAE